MSEQEKPSQEEGPQKEIPPGVEELIKKTLNILGRTAKNYQVVRFILNNHGVKLDAATSDETINLIRNQQRKASNVMSRKNREDSTRASLSHRQYFLLCSWLQKHQERLLKERPTYPDTSRQAEEELHFRVSPSSIADAMVTTGVKWESDLAEKLKSGLSGASVLKEAVEELSAKLVAASEKLADMEKKNFQLRVDLDRVNSLVMHLYKELEVKPPSGALVLTDTLKDKPLINLTSNCKAEAVKE